jgi:hypothetical protein
MSLQLETTRNIENGFGAHGPRSICEESRDHSPKRRATSVALVDDNSKPKYPNPKVSSAVAVPTVSDRLTATGRLLSASFCS